jgi:hypothetical protein
VIATQNKAAAAAVAAKDKADEEKRKQVENARFQLAVRAAITVRESMKIPTASSLSRHLERRTDRFAFHTARQILLMRSLPGTLFTHQASLRSQAILNLQPTGQNIVQENLATI